MPTMHTLCYNLDAIAPQGDHGSYPILWRRLSAAAYGYALLLLVTFGLDELAVS